MLRLRTPHGTFHGTSRRLARRTVALAAGAAVAVATPALLGTATADAAAANPQLALTTGTTSLALYPATASALTKNHITVSPASEARKTSRGISFPITGGIVDSKTLAGTITHAGGLTFSAHGKKLTLRTFYINTRTTALSAYVDQLGYRIRVLRIALKDAKVFSSNKIVRVLNVRTVLAYPAATALNKYFGVSLFKQGLPIGVARVDSYYKAYNS